ncbi:hypothetical protein EAG_04426 [Camponotus floridanus]|uniref:Uncharacterized protein n=1 Tax=Camponotus floridanus TaxID=104421 RepID=E2AF84_CAMFO|nr:hypothetical protein EAG_04426 [Camponotus floridanus]
MTTAKREVAAKDASPERITESEREDEGDTYVSSREDPVTPRQAATRRGRLAAPEWQAALTEGTESPCMREAVKIQRSIKKAIAISLSDASPEIGSKSNQSSSRPKSSGPKRKKGISSSELETTGESAGQRVSRPRGAKLKSKYARPSRKKPRPASPSRRDSANDDEWSTDGEQPEEEEQRVDEQPVAIVSSLARPEEEDTAPPPSIEKGGRMRGRKPFLNKEKVAKRIIMELEEVPQDMDELRNRSTPNLGAMAQRWIDELDFIRKKCKTMQGPLMKRMSERTSALTMLVQLLSERIQDNGDIAYLKKQNIEKTSRIDLYEKEINKLKNEVSALTELVADLQTKALRAMEDKERTEASRIQLLKTKIDRVTPMLPIMGSPSDSTNIRSGDTYLQDGESLMAGTPSEDAQDRLKRSRPLEFEEDSKPGKRKEGLGKSKIVLKNTYPKEEEFPPMGPPSCDVRPGRSERDGPLMSHVDSEKEKEELVRRITKEVIRQMQPVGDRRLLSQTVKLGDQVSSPLPRNNPRVRVKSDIQLVPPRENAPTPRPPQTPGALESIGMSGGDAGDTNSDWSAAKGRVRR